MSSGYNFRILDSSGNPTAQVADFDDMFVPRDLWETTELATSGNNSLGQAGRGAVSTYAPFQSIDVSSSNWWNITIGAGTVAATKTNGTLWTWGNNASGSLGLGDLTHRSSPVQVGALTDWYTVATGGDRLSSDTAGCLAIKTNGTLWAWGSNSLGKLGLGDTTDRSSPVQVGALTDWKQISCGDNHCLAIKTDGTLWAWGDNTYGQLGLGDTTHRSSPVQVGSLTNWKFIAAGGTVSAAITNTNSLFMWGYNLDGQLALGDTTHRSSPVQVGASTDWKQIDVSSGNVHAIRTNGTLWAWGNGGQGSVYNLGLGAVSTHRSSPVQVGALTNWKQVAVNKNGGGAIRADGTYWAWGYNSASFGFNSTITIVVTPTQVTQAKNWKRVVMDKSITPSGKTTLHLTYGVLNRIGRVTGA